MTFTTAGYRVYNTETKEELSCALLPVLLNAAAHRAHMEGRTGSDPLVWIVFEGERIIGRVVDGEWYPIAGRAEATI